MRPSRVLVPLVGAAALVLVPLSGLASAHVTVQAPGATQGGYTKLVFRVPTEKDVATTRLEIVFPQEAPIGSVRVKPHPGWTAELVQGPPATPLEVHGRTVESVVQRIVWTTDGPGIGAEEFDEFEVSAGPLPEVDTMVFKALQTYADGEVVRWIEEAAPGAEDPDKPAPVLELAPATEEAHGAAASASPEAGAEAVRAETVAASTPTDEGGDGLALTALVASGAAIALGGTALVRGRRS